MKIYTEEQVIELMYWISPVYMDREDIKIFLKNKSTPIELPSDEEMAYEVITWNVYNMTPLEAFRHGVNWTKEQILNQNK